MIFAEWDLSKADVRVVAWDSDCANLKQLFAELDATDSALTKNHGLSCLCLYCRMGQDLFSSYEESQYHSFKACAHLTNYAGRPPTLAKTVGCTQREAQDFQSRYFSQNPEIKEWHRRIRDEIATGFVSTPFGHRWVYHSKPTDALVRETLSRIPQACVSEVINRGIKNVFYDPNLAWCELLNQVHDSACAQWPVEYHDKRHLIHKATEVVIPYPDPLIIERDLETGSDWGHLEATPWQ
jgi:hypothetical protein